MDWARILAFVTGTVDQELLARIEYLAAASNRPMPSAIQHILNWIVRRVPPIIRLFRKSDISVGQIFRVGQIFPFTLQHRVRPGVCLP
jgi:hypothetical protein